MYSQSSKKKSYPEIKKACGNGTCYTYALQILLASKWAYGSQKWVIDGMLWAKTKEAVRAFQNAYNQTYPQAIPLEIDWDACPLTLDALLEEDTTAVTTSSPTPTKIPILKPQPMYNDIQTQQTIHKTAKKQQQ